MKRAIHWFRRDLRITDNTALRHAIKESEEVVPVYILSSWKRFHNWTGSSRQEFLCGSLASLAANLEAIGGRLIFREGKADEELFRLVAETKAEAIFFNRDPDPFGIAMEDKLRQLAKTNGIAIHDFKDISLFERNEIKNGSGQPYRVFTPYAKAWNKLPKEAPAKRPVKIKTPTAKSLPLPGLEHWGLKSDSQIVAPGEKAARKRLEKFLDGPIYKYAESRNIPYGETTSRLSQDLRYGTLSIREIYHKCMALLDTADAAGRKSILTYINELAWREFYFQILWHYPEVLQKEFNEKHRHLKWWKIEGKSAEAFDRWKDGTTGFPIVDAAMRQLNSTGFMHNRLRMITAMFLTKDLHLDWREGERYFMQRLTDGEIASNNGGWQWSAGTGADAAPYFRIQNPWLQSERFDPEGLFIKAWIPELRDVQAKVLHKPPTKESRLASRYPTPIVDHSEARDITLAMFRTA